MANLETIKEEVIDLMIEMQREKFDSKEETFDDYKTRVKEDYAHSWSDYFAKLTHGYEVILNVINQENNNNKKH